ncbi:MAG: YaaL family protein [Tumebacillaceae bacterium]
MKEKREQANGWNRWSGLLRGRKASQAEIVQKDEYEQLCQEIEAARAEWAIAQQHIDYVSDPELIDHAIYYLEAAERKYGYLLREAKKKYGERLSKPHVVPQTEPSL